MYFNTLCYSIKNSINNSKWFVLFNFSRFGVNHGKSTVKKNN